MRSITAPPPLARFAIAAVLTAAMSIPPLAAAAPDGRGYELVSPSDKGGTDVSRGPSAVRASADGSAVVFDAPAGLPEGEGTGVTSTYVSRRGANGWSTKGLTPPQVPNPYAVFSSTRYFDFTDDLSKGVVRSYGPIVSGAEPIHNLYLRDTATGGYELLSPAFQPLAHMPVAFGAPVFAGGSADLSRVLLESTYQLTPDAASDGSPNLYEYADGELRLAGVLPNGDPAPSSQAGVGALNDYSPTNTMSDDGRRVFFASPAGFGVGRLYLRIDGSETVEVSESERTAPDPAGQQPVTYGTANPDGSFVTFMTAEQLTDDDTDDRSDVYRYDATRPASDPDNLTLISADGQPSDGEDNVVGVVAVTDDGDVYFVAYSELVPGQPSVSLPGGMTANRLYRWHQGVVSYVSTIENVYDFANWLPAQPIAHPSNRKASRLGRDGEVLLFSSVLPTPDYDTASPSTDCLGSGDGHCRQFYIYDADDGSVTCVTCPPSGEQAKGPARIARDRALGAMQNYAYDPRALSEDGRRVFFESPNDLTADDTNGRVDPYMWEDGELTLLSPGTGDTDTHFADASASGDDVFILSRERLDPADRDSNLDVYDVRVGGGFGPAPDGGTPCSGDGCQTSSPADAAPPIASVDFEGAGDVPPALGRVRVARLRAVLGTQAALRVRVPARGRVVISGRGVRRASKVARRAGAYTVRLRLSAPARRALARRKAVAVRVRVVFKSSSGRSSRATLVVRFKSKSSRKRG